MTISELTINDLYHIKGNYWYSSFNGIKNIFYIRRECNKIKEIEPTELKEMLIELSDKVPVGNNFTSIVECLKIPFIFEARLLDEEWLNYFF